RLRRQLLDVRPQLGHAVGVPIECLLARLGVEEEPVLLGHRRGDLKLVYAAVDMTGLDRGKERLQRGDVWREVSDRRGDATNRLGDGRAHERRSAAVETIDEQDRRSG